MRILVTGADGFIGRHVVRAALARGHRVRAVVRQARSPEKLDPESKADRVVQDLREPGSLARHLVGTDAVVHCAAALDGPENVQRANTITGTENLLRAMQAADVGSIVAVSTFALYDYLHIAEGTPLDEDGPLDDSFIDRAPYVRVKREQEALVRAAARERGWQCTTVRPGVVYGPGRTWFHQLGIQLGRRLWVSLAGRSTFPLIYVENCADALVLAAEAPPRDDLVLNLVDDLLPERRLYLRELARRSAVRPLLTDVPWGLLRSAAAYTSALNRTVLGGRALLPDLLRPASLHARCKPLGYSNARAKEMLGWRPARSWPDTLDPSLGRD